MKKLFTLVLVVLCAGFSFAQDTYRQKMMQLIANGENVEQAKQILAQKVSADSLNLSIFDDLIQAMGDIYEEPMRKYVSEGDLDWLIAWNNAPQTVAINEKSMQLAQRLMQQDPTTMQVFTELITGITQLVKNEKTTDIQKADVSKKYRKAFHSYYTESGVEETIGTMFNGLKNMFASQLKDDDNKMITSMSDYLSRNMEEFTLRLMSDVLTIEDLKYYTDNMKQPAYKHYQQAQQEVISNPAKLMEAIYKVLPMDQKQETE